jgi:hypothetical protein
MDILIALSSNLTNPMVPDFFNVLASKQASKQVMNNIGLFNSTWPNAWASDWLRLFQMDKLTSKH